MGDGVSNSCFILVKSLEGELWDLTDRFKFPSEFFKVEWKMRDEWILFCWKKNK